MDLSVTVDNVDVPGDFWQAKANALVQSPSSQVPVLSILTQSWDSLFSESATGCPVFQAVQGRDQVGALAPVPAREEG